MAPLRKRKIRFEIDDQPIATIKKTKRNGQFRARLLVKEADLLQGESGRGGFELSARDRESSFLAGTLPIRMIPAEGHSIISDIDDTIKFSNVENVSNCSVKPVKLNPVLIEHNDPLLNFITFIVYTYIINLFCFCFLIKN